MAYYWRNLPNNGAPGAIANNYLENFPTSIASNQGDIRVDHNITGNQTAFARLTYKKRNSSTAPSGATFLGGGDSLEDVYSIAAAHNTVLSPNMVNEARVGISSQNTSTEYGYTSQEVANALGLNLPSIAEGRRVHQLQHHWLHRNQRRQHGTIQVANHPVDRQRDLEPRPPQHQVRRGLPLPDGPLHQRLFGWPHEFLHVQ